jgi:hypothetical protein
MIPPNPVVPNTAVINIDASLNNLSGIDRIVSFAEDAVGNLFLVDMATGPNNAPNANSGEVYRILTNSLLAGDYNADGTVDDADYTGWRATFGTATGNPPADGNRNGVVDAADYVVWRKNVGTTVDGAGSLVSVPEPASVAIIAPSLILVLLATLTRRRTNIH